MPYLKYLFYCFLICCCHNSKAQEVIASSGLYGTNSSGSLSITIGEVITESGANNSGLLTQGFQQNYESLLALKEIAFNEILLYPNPFTSCFFIQGNFTAEDELLMYDLNLKLVKRQALTTCQTCQIDVTENSASAYLIYHSKPGQVPRFVGTLIHSLP